MRVNPLLPSREELVDGAFVVAVGALALSAFRATFGDAGFLVEGGAGLVGGLLLAHAGLRFRTPVLATMTGAIVVFFAFGCAIVASAPPSAATLRVVASISVGGWKDLLTTLPPIGSTGPLLVIPYLVGIVAGTAGCLLARRTRAALLPTLPAVGVLILGILVGTASPVSTMLEGGALGGLAVLWGAIRRARGVRSTVRTRRRAERLVMAVFVAGGGGLIGVFTGPRLPFAGSHDRVVLRSYVHPPFDPLAYPSPLQAFRRYAVGGALNKALLFTVHGLPTNARLRLATMDSYHGVAWVVRNGDPGTSGSFQRAGSDIPTGGDGVLAHVVVRIGAYDDVWLPTAGIVRHIAFTGPRRDALADSFRYSLATNSGVEPIRVWPGDSYRLDVVLPPSPPRGQLAAATAGGDTADVADAPPNLAAAAKAWIGSSSTPYASLDAIRAYLRDRGKYSDGTLAAIGDLTTPAGHGKGKLTRFIQATELVGDDEQYAAAFALAANQLGVPARVVLGATPEPDGTVRGKDVHAWVEAEFGAGTWVPFDPTPAPNHQPTRVTPPAPLVTSKPVRVPPPVASPPPPGEDAADARATSALAARRASQTTTVVPAALAGAVRYVAPPIGGLGLVLGSIVAIKSGRQRRRRTRGTPDHRVAMAFTELVDLAVDLGLPRPAGTRRMIARAISDEAGVLARSADGLVFAPDAPTDDAASGYWVAIDVERARLRGGVSVRRRLLAAVSTASFRRVRAHRSRHVRKPRFS